jgi:hypothetical protein
VGRECLGHRLRRRLNLDESVSVAGIQVCRVLARLEDLAPHVLLSGTG